MKTEPWQLLTIMFLLLTAHGSPLTVFIQVLMFCRTQRSMKTESWRLLTIMFLLLTAHGSRLTAHCFYISSHVLPNTTKHENRIVAAAHNNVFAAHGLRLTAHGSLFLYKCRERPRFPTALTRRSPVRQVWTLARLPKAAYTSEERA
ncbi:hypothetical protein Desac_1573 [Desulfobacca acetoxidans DSM 11109]|uniref:Uncharacterized protein n=1 Tax=Desulfobacca acetoxidans (strain ATCC 700848 / DSM 11109 / ASRB2) TaxID=880072 RepID=F2NHU2_DESAR|nr:hypothetical protein Desac_1573 [Desulfobacca acetoxidans DSM 11109]